MTIQRPIKYYILDCFVLKKTVLISYTVFYADFSILSLSLSIALSHIVNILVLNNDEMPFVVLVVTI